MRAHLFLGMALDRRPSAWSRAIFASALPIGGMRLIRARLLDDTHLAIVVDVGTQPRTLADVAEWIGDATRAAGITPILLSFYATPRHPRRHANHVLVGQMKDLWPPREMHGAASN